MQYHYPFTGPITADQYPNPTKAFWLRMGFYVYALVDPRPNPAQDLRRVFYIGKGQNGRVLTHVWNAFGLQEYGTDDEAGREERLERIRAIHADGYHVQLVILHYLPHAETGRGLEQEILSQEATMIDLLRLERSGKVSSDLTVSGLTNKVAGHGSRAALLHELVRKLTPTPVERLPWDVAAVCVNSKYRPGMTYAEIVTIGSDWWRIGKVWTECGNDLPIIVHAANTILAVRRPTVWREDGQYRGYESVADSELEAELVGKYLSPAMVGLKSWPQGGWSSQVPRKLIDDMLTEGVEVPDWITPRPPAAPADLGAQEQEGADAAAAVQAEEDAIEERIAERLLAQADVT